MIPRIIVMGRNSTPLGVVRSLGKVGYDVDVLYFQPKPGKMYLDKAKRREQRLRIRQILRK